MGRRGFVLLAGARTLTQTHANPFSVVLGVKHKLRPAVLQLSILVNVLLFFALAFTIGIKYLSLEDVAVRVIDNTGCNLNSYEIKLPEKSVSVSEAQRGARNTPSPQLGNYDTLIRFRGLLDKNDSLEYVLVANYTDCESIVSEPRSAKIGHAVYEIVSKTGVKYFLRSSE
jgi:hypothetical protein